MRYTDGVQGQALTAGGHCQEAIDAYRAVVDHVGAENIPKHLYRDLLTNMGQAHRELVEIEAAEECYRNATILEPRYVLFCACVLCTLCACCICVLVFPLCKCPCFVLCRCCKCVCVLCCAVHVF